MSHIFVVLCVKLILIHLNSLTCQSINEAPESPCPDRFFYIPNDGEVQGMIIIDNFESNMNNEVSVKFTNEDGSVGKQTLSVMESDDEVFENIKNRRPIHYMLKFRKSSSIPEVIEIKSNGKIICSKEKPPYSGTASTRHNLNVMLPSNNNPPPPPKTQTFSNRPTSELPPPAPSRTTSSIGKIWTSLKNRNPDGNCGTLPPVKSTITTIALIYGGEKMEPGTWPWLVAILDKSNRNRYFCGGSIITPNAIITAAHCVYLGEELRSTQSIAVGLGSFDLRKNEPDTYVANVRRIIPNPGYKIGKQYHADLAIIILSQSYNFNYRIQPVCIWDGPTAENNVVNKVGRIAGWGLSKVGGDVESEPTIVDAIIEPLAKCLLSDTRYSYEISDANFCAGYRNGKGPCQGDSGSGLILNVDDKWYLRGLVSGALYNNQTKSCDLNNFIIYTDVAQFLDWIRSHVNL